MSINANSPALSADALEEFLDETEEALDEQIESELASSLIQNNLRAALQRHQYRADTLERVRRLANLWSRAGEHDAALQVLDQDGKAVQAAVTRDEYDDTLLTLALTRVGVLGHSPERALPAAEAAYTLLCKMAYDAQSHEAWDYLGSLAGRTGHYELERRCAEGLHAYQCAQAAREPCRAFDKANTALWRAHSYAHEGLDEQARSAAAEALRAYQDAGPEQDVDVNDWLHLGNSLVPVMPQSIATVIERVHALATATAALPRRRDIAIRAARLQARALYQQGALADALQTARAGRYALDCHDDNDAFSALVLDWLLEAGRQSEAAALAFECVFNDRVGSRDHACRVALAQLDDDHTRSGSSASSPYWPLLLAYASTVEETKWVAGAEDPAYFFRAQLQLAREGGAAQPAIDAVEGLYLFDCAHDNAAALPLLESAARDPALATPAVVPKIWLCRMQLHGVDRALHMPFVDIACAGWCYTTALLLQNETRDALAPGSDWPKKAVDALAARYYERGAALFEHFFATGQGMYRDGDVHVYSMLCNNLAIHYRINTSDDHAAIALHRKGIEASPFAEHHEGLMYCLFRLEDEAGFIDAAERLWHYAAEYGYSRHHAAGYILDVVNCLMRQERWAESAVWRQRLDQWWNSLNEGERSRHARDYWACLSVTLYCLGKNQEADALARLEAVLPELCAVGEPMATRVAANSLSRAGQHERALPLYRLALEQLEQLKRIEPVDEWHHRQRKAALQQLADCEQQIRANRPWWRFWK